MNRRLAGTVDSLLGQEKGTVRKDHEGRIMVCLAYPNSYGVGMSNLGFLGIYGLLNRRDDVVCERVFLPADKDLPEYGRTKTPLFSYETKTPLERFDIIAFSLSFENDYPNVLTMLELARVPLTPEERTPYHPLVIGGGICVTANPEPVAPLFDLIFIGEADESLDEFLDIFADARRNAPRGQGGPGRDRASLTQWAATLPGLYVPELYDVAYRENGTIVRMTSREGAQEKVRRRYLKDLSASPIRGAVTTPESEFSNMHLVEVMRGCPWKCRFCLVGHLCAPVRKKDVEAVKREIGTAQQTGRKIGLIGPSLTDYPHIEEVLRIQDVDFSITSLRSSRQSAVLLEFLKSKKSVSIAPEAGTERMRRIIHKRIGEADIIETAALILGMGLENLRLYFMVGLPWENDDDVKGIVDLVRKARGTSGRGTVTVSVSTFVPKPFTPFQWHPMDQQDDLKRKLRIITKGLKDVRGVRVFHDVPKYARMQGLLSLGDRRVFKILTAMGREGDWMKACRTAKVDPDFYISRQREYDEVLPWDFIDAGVGKEELWEEYEEAKKCASSVA